MLPAMVIGALLALPGVAAALMLAEGADAATIRDANLIYVYHRLDHHLVFHRFPHWFILRHAALLLVWVVICFLTPCRTSGLRNLAKQARYALPGSGISGHCGVSLAVRF
jgi:hypothetical protein